LKINTSPLLLFFFLLLFCLNSLGSNSINALSLFSPFAQCNFFSPLLAAATAAMCCPSQVIKMCPCHRSQTPSSEKLLLNFNRKCAVGNETAWTAASEGLKAASHFCSSS